MTCLDVGQSTGGFTDALLQRGATHVVGVDVGHGQIHPRLAADARVTALEGVNARHLEAGQLPFARFDLVVGDLSFISLALVLPALVPLAGRRPAAARQAAVRAAAGRHRLERAGEGRERLPSRRGEAAQGLRKPRPGRARLVRQRHAGQRRRARVLPPRPPCDEDTAIMTMRLPIPVSFEFFPPNTPVGSEKLKTVVRELAECEPEFFSVTYGAGGSTRDKTLATVSDIAALGQEAAPHLSCVGSTRESISEILATYRSQKIRRLVALRGDLPSGTATAGEFRYASELIALHPRDAGQRLVHRGRGLSRVPPAAALRQARPRALRRQGEGRRELGDHAVLLQPRRLLPLRRRGARARRRRADRAGRHALPQLRADRPVRACATASRSRAGWR